MLRINNRPAKQKLALDDRIFYAIVYISVILLTLTVMYPLIFILSASFSSPHAVSTGKVILFPVEFSLQGYERVLANARVHLGFRNTLFYTLAGTAINVSMTMICAYPLARKNLPHRSLISSLFVISMLFSGGMIPNYMLIRNLGMLNTIWAILIPGSVLTYQMIITRTFIQNTIPDDMLEAAQIDGCNDIRYFFMFVLPLSKAVIAVIALQYAVSHWNSFMGAFIYLNDRALYPLQVFLREILVMSQISAEDIIDEEMASVMQGMADLLKYSLIVVATLPILFVYPFIQKYFVKGVMLGSLKG